MWDLARAHVDALDRFDNILAGSRGYDVINVGTGEGVTVRELVSSFEAAVNRRLRVIEGAAPPG